jgi:2-dehydro-3-deoxygalactonokinase
MDGVTAGCFVGIDMGTTNTRAWLVHGDRIVARARALLGVRDAAVAGASGALRSAVGEMVAELAERGRRSEGLEPDRVVAAGMITSRLGLAEVPHVAAPAGARELTAAVEMHRFDEIVGLDVYLIPGVRTGAEQLTPREIGAGDVMRGEETLCFGLIGSGLLEVGGTLLNLGSHWKAIRIDREARVAASTTSLSGELLHAAQTRTVLAGSVPGERPERLEESWVRAGIEEATRSGLSRALFCVRLLEQRTSGGPMERLSFMVGAFIGAELESLCRFHDSGSPIVVAGGGVIANAFAAVLQDRHIEVRVLSDADVETAMVRGLGLLAGRGERVNG